MKPGDYFHCVYYRCRLRAAVCVARQLQRIKYSARSEKTRPAFSYCASGQCEQGAGIRAKVGEVAVRRLEFTGTGKLVEDRR